LSALITEQSPASECQAIEYAKQPIELETRKQHERLRNAKDFKVLKLRRRFFKVKTKDYLCFISLK
jgi:hypothetical protein